MNPNSIVSIHPYFKPHEGKLEEFKAGFSGFVEKTSSEEGCLNYDFSVSDDIVFCRESYVSGEAALAHLDNVGENLGAALAISDLIRLEVHGAAEELDKMREALKELPVQWFVVECSLKS